ncbi:MAG: quinone-interacting membrane-bound oxidoreductase complex subunit QmoC [Deltaproteobacteria bacterium]|nr:quinone-interacting membrane-bound oxidoreductase complex subunit QmoC [Deltaproteobacteria bacterium]
MAQAVFPSASFRDELKKRGGGSAFRCYQCATCSSVCELAPADSPFPRKQMLYAQWGLADKLAADPSVWLCHQCNDCTVRCPRDAKPGDVMQTVRSLAVEEMATPKFMGKLVGKARVTWWLLIGIPLAFWMIFIHQVNGFAVPELSTIHGVETFAWHDFVPHWMIYVTYVPVTAFVLLMVLISGAKYWKQMGQTAKRSGSFIGNLIPAVIDILTHKKFSKCDAAKPRKTGHLIFMFGFIGAAITTALIVVAMYGWVAEPIPLPLPLSHWMKWIGNISAALLVLGGLILLVNRMRGGNSVGTSTAYDNFFLFVAVMVGFTGIATALARLYTEPATAIWIYVAHLTFILTLFITFPYSKFAHIVYRTLAMVHDRMASK